MPIRRTPPRWPASSSPSRPRVLVEHDDLGVAAAAERILERDGYDVAVCGGPSHLRRGRCPLVEGHGCALVEDADVVVQCLNLGWGPHREVTRAVRRHRPGLPVVIEATPGDVADRAPLLEGATTLGVPMTRAALEGAVRRALSEAPSPPTPPTPPPGPG